MNDVHRAQNNRVAARIAGILMIGLMVFHWYIISPWLSIEYIFRIYSIDILMMTLDSWAIVGFFSLSHEHGETLIMFAFIVAQMMW